jgi:L-fucose mutarotase
MWDAYRLRARGGLDRRRAAAAGPAWRPAQLTGVGPKRDHRRDREEIHMLFGIDPILGPDLLHALRAMGHGDELAIVDANYPALAKARRLVRLDGVDAVHVLDAVLSLMPLDDFVDCAAFTMEPVDDPKATPEVCRRFGEVIAKRAPGFKVGTIERFAFYDRANTAFVTVATGERRLYGNIILKKGIIRPEAG